MWNRLTKYDAWIRRWKEDLIDAWECGFHPSGNPITEQTYEDFVANCWKSYQESEVNGLA